ncbi:MAG: M3 family oligoendopeptidase [Firmicutes bacterium]|nr:M3 family oligoendopeptidase [Bacillota bacterium]
MRTTWTLEDLYLGFQDPNLLKDLEACDGLREKYEAFTARINGATESATQLIEDYLDAIIHDTILLRKLQAFGHLTFATHSKSQEALALKNKVQQYLSDMTPAQVAFKVWLNTIDDLEQMALTSTKVNTHLFYLKELKDFNHHLLSSKEEVLISKLTATGSSAWETLQSKVSSQLVYEVNIDGTTKEMPIMAIRNLAFSSDREVRKLGYMAELAAYESHAEISAAALNGIKGEVLTLSKLRGFESPLDETLYHSRMDRETLSAMIAAMEAYLPIFRRYLLAKSRLLGNKGPMPFFDLFAPVTTTDAVYTIAEARTFIVKYFKDYSTDLSEFADMCFEKGWIDFEPAAGKVGGAFCSNIPSIRQSRVLLNFTGKLKNVLTIAHELGHAFHGDRIMSESILNTSYPMPLAETASIFCETIVRNAVLKDADNEQKLAILENSLQGATQVIVDILSRYYFETELFERRTDHPVSVDELKSMMISAQIRAYGDGLNHNTLHPFMWLNKNHYYYANRNFYNFPYAFGLLFATGLYAKYLEDSNTFIPAYDQMLKATGKMNIKQVCGLMNIDPTSTAFWNASLEKIKSDVETFEMLVAEFGKTQ